MAQDDYYYEIQLTNKQLVFYFMAGATGLILSFLAGVMVGRGVDAAAGDVQAARPPREERIVAEEPRPVSSPPAQELGYAQRLEAERSEDSLEKKAVEGAPLATASPAKTAVVPVTLPAAKTKEPATSPRPPAPTAKAAPAPPKPSSPGDKATPAPLKKAAASPPKGVGPAPGTFTIQVGAFKDKAAAESVVNRLKAKGFPAHVVTPDGTDGLFNVRVGAYTARADAERVQDKLRDEEKFKPFIVRQ